MFLGDFGGGGGGLAVDIWRVCCELVEGRRRRGLNGDWRL